MSHIKKATEKYWPVVISVIFLVLIGGTMISGCAKVKAKNATLAGGDKVEDGGTMNKETKIGENANVKTDVKVDKVDVGKNLESIAKLEDKIETLNGQIAKMRDLTQTNNTGILSGGAPYLLAVIMVMLYFQKHVQVKSRDRELDSKNKTIDGLETTLKTLSNNAKIQSITDVIKKDFVQNAEKQE